MPHDANTFMILAVGAISAWNAYQQAITMRRIAELKVWIYQNFVAKAREIVEPAE